jgi:hypothetical protein
VQFFELRCPMVYADVNRGRGRSKRLHLTENYFERVDASANSGQRLESGTFASRQCARRQQCEVSRKIRQAGMQLPPEFLYELSNRAFNIRDQRIPQALHIPEKL